MTMSKWRCRISKVTYKDHRIKALHVRPDVRIKGMDLVASLPMKIAESFKPGEEIKGFAFVCWGSEYGEYGSWNVPPGWAGSEFRDRVYSSLQAYMDC